MVDEIEKNFFTLSDIIVVAEKVCSAGSIQCLLLVTDRVYLEERRQLRLFG